MAPEWKFVVKFVVQPILSNVISLSIYETGLRIPEKNIIKYIAFSRYMEKQLCKQ